MPDKSPAQMALLPDDEYATDLPQSPVAPPAVPCPAPPGAPLMNLTLDDDERAYWVAWNRVRGIGPARFTRLLAFFPDAATAWVASIAELRAAGLDEHSVTEVDRQRRAIEPLAEMALLEKLAVVALTLRDEGYPRLLREIAQPPAVLYVRGSLTADDDVSLAIVGTRHATAYGRHVTATLARDLSEQGLTIVSGLARGVDQAAHVAALEAGGRTIAVQGCGPDLVYPPSHAQLAARIAESGAVVSEFAPGTPPEAGNFPARNRVISGLSLAVLITEAPEKSGALITAQFAGEQGRDVMAVPGNIVNRSSVGCNRLIQDGAICVIVAADVVSALNLHLVPQQFAMRELLPADDTEALILRLLDDGDRHVDDLCRAAGLPAATVSGALVMMELKGLVRGLGGMLYARA